MLASVITNEAARILNDAELGNEKIRWTVPELLVYLTEGIAAVVQGKPSLFVAVVQLALGPGSTQRLPDAYSRILDIHFNINPDGTEGPNVLPGVYALQQAFEKPGCRTRALIEVYSAYPGSERFFWVDPPVPRNLTYTPMVEALVQVAPQPVTAETQPIIFPGSSSQLYQAALVDWVLYRCYAKDEQSTTSFERSQSYYRSFGSYMGVAATNTAPAKKSSGGAATTANRARMA